ncbi:MAG: MMPL family transporter [Dehalococcoidia bacterium]|nr:MMPL family transporter [Dehalococcoidia bacterium]
MSRPTPTPQPSLLERWGRLSHRRRGWVILCWAVALVALVALARTFGGSFEDDFKLPGSEAQKGLDLLKSRFPARAGDASDLVFQAPGGVETPAVRQRIDALLADIATVPGVVSVESPYSQPSYVSLDGTIARGVVHWDRLGVNLPHSAINQFLKLTDATNGGGLRVEAGGRAVQAVEQPQFGSEIVGLLAAVVILFFAFGSVAAMGLPIGAALFGIGSGVAAVILLGSVYTFPGFTSQFVLMIGIGVGIDYSLIVVTRYREGLHTGHSIEDSVAMAVATSGRAVIFAGSVVAIAFFGLWAMGLPFIAAVGTASAIVVAAAVLVALTLIPALLSLIGRQIDRLHVPFLHTREGVDPASGWYRLSRAIQRRPLPYAIAGTGLLLLIAAPVLSLEMGFTDAGNKPSSYHSRRAYDLLADGFGKGFNGPLSTVLDLAHGSTDSVTAVSNAIAATPGVAAVAPPVLNPTGDTAIILAYPATSPQDPATRALAHRLREEVLPAATASTGARPYLSGGVAASIDIEDRIGERMPFLFVGVIGLSFLLLMAVFRSVAIPIKAALMNLLSIGAAYGTIVAVFQWGWGADLLGVEPGPVEVFLPMMFFAILFGLSMDYEVFLIARIREYYVVSGDNAEAVANGLAATARVITAAAAIMVAVFLAFLLGEDRIVKEVGLGLATAIFFDATVVRLVLVPATMELLGDANWWLPRWLDRVLPHLHLEGPVQVEQPLTAPAGGQ